MNATKIQYVDETWNTITGCSNTCCECRSVCWAAKMAHRLAANPRVPHRERYDGFKPAFWPERLQQPMRMKRPRWIATNFMADMFSEGVPDKWVAKTFAAMALCPQHTFLVLTKRPDRMARLFSINRCFELDVLKEAHHWQGGCSGGWPWPLSNVLLGTSISNQQTADERIPQLLKCPGRKWLSIEPITGPVDLAQIKNGGGNIFPRFNCLQRWTNGETTTGIDWVVCGGGPNPVHPEWVQSIRDQCAAASVPFWFKQWGEWLPYEQSQPPFWESQRGDEVDGHGFPDGLSDHRQVGEWYAPELDGIVYRHVGKKHSGDFLDGVQHHNKPR